LLSTPAMIGIVAQSLASLHSDTAEAESSYLQIRRNLGCEKQPEATWLSIRLSDAFRFGSEKMLTWCAALAPQHLSPLKRQVDEARQVVTQAEGCNRTFIHHDLVSSRQCIFRSGSLYLLDFEHSRFGHRLIDVASLLIGKVEVAKDDQLVPIHASLPPAFANAYRRQWDMMLTSPMSDLEWQRELCGVLVWQTLTEIGRCLLMPDRVYVLGFLGTIRSLLQRLQDQLILFEDRVPMRGIVRDLLQRMQGI